jgi:hypothetical protein
MGGIARAFWMELFKKILIIIGLALLGILLGLAMNAFGAEIDLGATERDGSVASQTYHAGLNVKSENAYASIEWNYGKIANIVTVDRGVLRFGYDPEISNNWSFWLFNQTGYNNPRGIIVENLLGAGPKYTFVKTQNISASLSSGIIYHYEDGPNGSRNLARLSVRPKAKISDSKASISFVGFYQPNLEDFGDYIITAKLISEHKVTERMSMKLILSDEYRSITKGSKNEFTRMLVMGIKL